MPYPAKSVQSKEKRGEDSTAGADDKVGDEEAAAMMERVVCLALLLT